MPAEVKQIVDRSMSSNETLSLANRLELPHTTFTNPSSFMGLLCPIVFILFGGMDRLRNYLSAGYWVAS
jgi:hypothetical protein